MYTLTRKPKSIIEIFFSVPWGDLEPQIVHSAKELGKELKMNGFRSGNVPTDVVRQKFSDLEILQKYLDDIISHFYYNVVKTEKLLTLGPPKISVFKIVEGNPLEFSATVALVPNVKLANLRELSIESRPTDVGEQEVLDVLEELRRTRALRKQNQTPENSQQPASPNPSRLGRAEADRGEQSTPTPLGDRGSDQSVGAVNKEQNNETLILPELNDEFARSVGKFENLEALKNALQSNLEQEKEYEESIRQENALIDLLIEKSEFEELPDVLLESELNQVFHEFKHAIERRGAVFPEWLEHVNKTEEELKKGLAPQALRRAKSSLLLRMISEQEKLEPTEEEVKEETSVLFQQYPDPRQQEELLKPEFVEYFRRVLISKKTMRFLKEIMVK